jgi:DNA mismatch endonuclease (patch repair protein)
MRAIGGRNTGIEQQVQEIIRRLGFRFDTNRKDLPGNPDIVLLRRKTVLFVNGCFWHGHYNCSRASLPKTNRKFWKEKIHGNKLRDQRVKSELTKLGWKYIVIWQCQLRNPKKVLETIKKRIRQQPSK